MNTSRAFTLIETIIYVGLLTFLMGSTMVAVYGIIQNMGRLSTRTVVQEEGNFVLRKLDWAFTGTSSMTLIVSPASGTCSATTSLNRADGERVIIRHNTASSSIEMSEMSKDGWATSTLTTANVSVAALQFCIIPALGAGPMGIEASTTLGGNVFYMKKYFRK